MDRLTNEEVLHVAKLARLELSDAEIEKYSYQLKSLLDEIDKIKDVKEATPEIMISPSNNECILRDNNNSHMIDKSLVLKHAPHVYEDYIEVRGVFDD